MQLLYLDMRRVIDMPRRMTLRLPGRGMRTRPARICSPTLLSALNDDEMKRLIIDVVDRAYRFIHTLFDEAASGQLLLHLAEHDPVPRWNEPTLETTALKPD
jgi:hypothetical protein